MRCCLLSCWCTLIALTAAEVDLGDEALWSRLAAAEDQTARRTVLADLALIEVPPLTGCGGPLRAALLAATGVASELPGAPGWQAPADRPADCAELLAAWSAGAGAALRAQLATAPAPAPWSATLACLASGDWRPLWRRQTSSGCDAREQLALGLALWRAGLGARVLELEPATGQSPWAWATLRVACGAPALEQAQVALAGLCRAMAGQPGWEDWCATTAEAVPEAAFVLLQQILPLLRAEPPGDDAALRRNAMRLRALLSLRDQVALDAVLGDDVSRRCWPDLAPSCLQRGRSAQAAWRAAWRDWQGGGCPEGLLPLGRWLLAGGGTVGRRDGAEGREAEACRAAVQRAAKADPGHLELATLAPRLQVMPDFVELEAAGTWIDSQVAFADLSRHVPGELRGDHFAIRWEGSLRVTTPGLHVFTLDSDDGSRLYIDDALVVDHHGRHAAIYDFIQAQGSVALQAGDHLFRLDYYEAEGGQAARAGWVPPGATAAALIPPAAFVHGPERRAGLQATWYRLAPHQVPENPEVERAVRLALAEDRPWLVALRSQLAAELRWSAEDLARVRRFLEENLTLAPERHADRRLLAEVHHAAGATDAAIAVLEAGLGQPRPAVLHLALGELLTELGRDGEALRHLLAAGNQPAALAALARLHEQRGEQDEARAIYQRLQEHVPSAATELLRLELGRLLDDRETLARRLAELPRRATDGPGWSVLALALWRHGSAVLLLEGDAGRGGSIHHLGAAVLAQCERGAWQAAHGSSRQLMGSLQWQAADLPADNLALLLAVHGRLAAMHGDLEPVPREAVDALRVTELSPALRQLWTRLQAGRPAQADCQEVDGWFEALRLLSRGEHAAARTLASRLAVRPGGEAAQALLDWYGTQSPEALQALPRDTSIVELPAIDDGSGAAGF